MRAIDEAEKRRIVAKERDGIPRHTIAAAHRISQDRVALICEEAGIPREPRPMRLQWTAYPVYCATRQLVCVLCSDPIRAGERYHHASKARAHERCVPASQEVAR